MEEGYVFPTSNPQVAALWAKSGDETGWLSLPQHMVDAACVAECLWETWLADSVKGYLTSATGLGEGDARILVSWLAGLHDCGKATTQFQCQIESRPEYAHIVAGVREAFPVTRRLTRERLRHELASEVILNRWLRRQGLNPRVALSLAQVAGAHHGKATDPVMLSRAEDLLDEHAEHWHRAHAELIAMINQATGMTTELLRRVARIQAPAQQLLTGLVIMADWIASNAEAFPMVTDTTQEERTRRGMAEIALTPPWRPESPGDLATEDLIDAYYRKIFGWPEEFGARPIQRAVVEALGEVEGPSLLIVEAPTGEGKTETALAAAQIIAGRTGAQGVVFAAPTMATANGLFERVLEWAEGAAAGEVASMYLGHSKSGLSASYRHIQEDRGEEHGAVVATQWLRGVKRGMLSNFVVCTVDQVLMLALQAKHSMLRHLGLAGKVIVVDEVHAYDAYMGSYLRRALEWLRHYGASVILMSATLPVGQKRTLAQAYGGGGAEGTAYPLLTVVDERGTREVPVPARPTELHASVGLLDDSPEALAALVEGGGCVLVVCNTIRRVQETYRLLDGRFPGEVELHHAAFMASDRAAKEDALRAALGPRAHRGAGRPERRCVVATQVVEQSLDIDVDLLVTDIAPMDLLIQRVGRLHRHRRPPEDRPAHLRQPQVFIRGVEKREPVPVFERGTAAIYDPAVLLATMAVLEERVLTEGLHRPDDIAPLVHAAYAEDREVPGPWREAWEQAREKSAAARERSERRAATYQLPRLVRARGSFASLFARYSEGNAARTGEEAGAAQVRDADPSVEVIPIVGGEYGYRPLGYGGAPIAEGATPEYPLALHLASSTVRLPGRLTARYSDFEAVITQLEEETPVGWAQSYLLKGQVALLLDENCEATINGIRLRYSLELGLEQGREEG
ncbi:CRISPR-associated helicase Cas3' [Corynebacterium sp. zg-331]|uniref:CRISPR-associated helicase Cas3' n=1 Tax=unclassified Corynebacterium TaxID=2624378 RepID=UPI00128CF363|nr:MULTISPECIES: CRISPR-associated helicase Cas3' [unclassified Corynebacterium]MBC3186611.1 CRISPR-associated helicase Cas3' [Corynebacterium sp. zg-331]MPV53095.1 CRISPR-associated helicase Cas3' [Corynebacterium sp. zg331]